jgi:hypothetical protein
MKAIIILFWSFLIAIEVNATNLRGQVVRYNPNTRTYYVLAGVRVDLIIWNGNQWVDVSYTVTGQDGFYYFINVYPGYAFRVQVFNNLFPA